MPTTIRRLRRAYPVVLAVLTFALAALALPPATRTAAVVPTSVVITEVAPWSSGNSPAALAADWFEVTNTTPSAVNIAGWKVDGAYPDLTDT